MKQNSNISLDAAAQIAIPQDILNDVPSHKVAEFRRGFIVYLYNEMPDLYQKIENASEISEITCQQMDEQVRKFAEIVKAKKVKGEN